MSEAGVELAAAAARLVGCRFRLHGRDPATGLDCVGLVAAALAACGRPHGLPNGYALKTRDMARFAGVGEALGFAPAQGARRAGDVLVLRAGPCQLHLAMADGRGGFIHAHAGLRRVVHTPAPPEGDIISHWRVQASA